MIFIVILLVLVALGCISANESEFRLLGWALLGWALALLVYFGVPLIVGF